MASALFDVILVKLSRLDGRAVVTVERNCIGTWRVISSGSWCFFRRRSLSLESLCCTSVLVPVPPIYSFDSPQNLRVNLSLRLSRGLMRVCSNWSSFDSTSYNSEGAVPNDFVLFKVSCTCQGHNFTTIVHHWTDIGFIHCG
ncbi:hypothetical protein TNCV_1592291 [Trichonephila clavipes]|nr:hypothetical protein TNCV_1592291 [Trichonephila clavipes]